MTEPTSPVRRWLHRLVPSQFHDPVGLAGRLVRSGDRAAYFALSSAALGVLMTPLDLLLTIGERRLYARTEPPRWPIILVCGPARSGTTLVAQTLIHNLPVGFFNNLTAIFTRAPLVANRLFGRRLAKPRPDYRSYYGKTSGWSAPNDALYLWDRWLGPDRGRPVATIAPPAAAAMRQFFGAAERTLGKPIVAKNNNLIGAAIPVAGALPTAQFVCLERDPVFLAQALLVARREIHGVESVPYGLINGAESADPVESVCHQVRSVTELGRQAAATLGPGRFSLISYEEFCADPSATIRQVGAIIAASTGGAVTVASLPPFVASSRAKIDPAILERFRDSLGDLIRR